MSGAGEFYFNYCAYADVDNKLYGFEILDGTKYTYADSAIAPYPASSSTTTLLGSDGKTSGLYFNQKSAIDCLTNPTVKLSTTTKVQCDATNTVSGEAKIESVVESDDGCTMTVTLSHAASEGMERHGLPAMGETVHFMDKSHPFWSWSRTGGRRQIPAFDIPGLPRRVRSLRAPSRVEEEPPTPS